MDAFYYVIMNQYISEWKHDILFVEYVGKVGYIRSRKLSPSKKSILFFKPKRTSVTILLN